MPLCEMGISFTDPSLPSSHIHTSTQTPSYMRPQTQHLTHTDTMRLRSPQVGVHPSDLYLNDVIINHTLQILHHHSPYTTTRHYLPTHFYEVIQRNNAALPRYHRRFLELQDGPSHDSSLLLILINITPTHWTMLVRTNSEGTIPNTVSHDSLPLPLDLTTTKLHLQHYDTVLQLTHGIAPNPIRHVTAVTHDDEYNCGVCVLMTTIIYFYHPTPTTFLWHTLNYSGSADHMRSVIISILAMEQPPRLYSPPTPHSPSPHLEPAHPHDATASNTPSPTAALTSSTSSLFSTIQYTKVATWNIDRQASYDGPIKACVHGDLNFLHSTKPAEHMTPGTRATSTLINTADKAGYVLYVTKHCHIYIRQATLHTRLLSQRSSYNGRLHTFVFQGSTMHPTTILFLYTFQRGHRDHSIATNRKEPDTAHSPTLFQQSIVTLTATLRTLYTNLTLLIMGNFQHIVSDTTLHRMGQRQPPPPANVLTQCLKHPFNLVSVIPTQYPTLAYHTWYSKSGTRRTGIDHILTAPEHINPNSPCGIDDEITTTLFKSDHYLIYASFDLQCPNTTPLPPTTTRYHYQRIAEIPLRKTYPRHANDSTQPWYAP